MDTVRRGFWRHRSARSLGFGQRPPAGDDGLFEPASQTATAVRTRFHANPDLGRKQGGLQSLERSAGSRLSSPNRAASDAILREQRGRRKILCPIAIAAYLAAVVILAGAACTISCSAGRAISNRPTRLAAATPAPEPSAHSQTATQRRQLRNPLKPEPSRRHRRMNASKPTRPKTPTGCWMTAVTPMSLRPMRAP